MAMLVAPCAPAAVRTPRKASKLPRAVIANLDRRFPGWQFASPNDSVVQPVNNERPRSAEDMCIGQADFDGNGTIDYAVHIKVGQSLNKTRLIVYLRHGSRYWHRTLERSDSLGELIVTVAPKGTRDFDYTNDRKIIYSLPTIMFAGEKGGYSYIYRRGRFYRIISSD